MQRRSALIALALAAALTPGVQADEPHYPAKPITIVVTFPPGGGTDLLARKLGQVLQQQLGQTVVVDNRPGASGNIGASQVARAAPDGYTLLMVNSSFAINPGVFGPLDFAPSRDFSAVINVGSVPSVLVVPPASPWHTLADLLASARSAVRPPFFASCGAGTPPAVVALLNRTLATALAGSELQADVRQLGYTLTRGEQATPAAFQALVARDLRRFGTITAQRGLRVD